VPITNLNNILGGVMDSSIHIFEEENRTTTMNGIDVEVVRSMVKQMNEIDEQIKDLREDKKELISDFIENHDVPKKEIMVAIRMLKGDIDPDVTSYLYANLADLVDI
tara:strand:+ start:917 stop:1237 length:321 start_codon:yes stop_codon:yes gene_type:complete